MIPATSLFVGNVMHCRTRPKAHKLRYRVFTMLLDLDDLSHLDQESRLFGYNRFAPFSFYDRDHGDGKAGGLKRWVVDQLQKGGLTFENGRVLVMCYPRVFGYVFNPLTLYFCYRENGALAAILYEVANTFGERHTYVIPSPDGNDGMVRQACRKRFHVSPFLEQEGHYDFRINPPDEEVGVAIRFHDRAGPMLFATFCGSRRPFTTKTLFGALVSFPLMTLKIIGAIHYEALRLWLKGIPVFPHRAQAAKITSSAPTQAEIAKTG